MSPESRPSIQYVRTGRLGQWRCRLPIGGERGSRPVPGPSEFLGSLRLPFVGHRVGRWETVSGLRREGDDDDERSTHL